MAVDVGNIRGTNRLFAVLTEAFLNPFILRQSTNFPTNMCSMQWKSFVRTVVFIEVFRKRHNITDSRESRKCPSQMTLILLRNKVV